MVQKNSATAEESASASEEMSAQAEQMNEQIDRLVVIAGQGTGSQVTAPTGIWGAEAACFSGTDAFKPANFPLRNALVLPNMGAAGKDAAPLRR